MITRKAIWLVALLLLQFCGISSAQSPSVTMLPEDLAALEQNCAMSEEALKKSLTELEDARELLTASELELTMLTQELNDSEETCAELRQMLTTLRTESARLKSELALLKAASVKASTDLAKAEQSLKATEQKYQKEHKRQARQTKMWQIIAFIAGGVALGGH